jgi:hypothetical protein
MSDLYQRPYWDHEPWWAGTCTCPGPTITDLSCPLHGDEEDQ